MLRSWRPGTGPRNGNSRKVLAGVLAQVLAKMGVLARVLAQVLAGWPLCEQSGNTARQHLCQHSGQHPHFCQHLCQHPRQHFSGIPVSGSCTRSPGSKWTRRFCGTPLLGPGSASIERARKYLQGVSICEVLSQYPRSAFRGLCSGHQRRSAAVYDPNPPRPFVHCRETQPMFTEYSADILIDFKGKTSKFHLEGWWVKGRIRLEKFVPETFVFCYPFL